MREPSSDDDPSDKVRVARLRPGVVVVVDNIFGGDGVDELGES